MKVVKKKTIKKVAIKNQTTKTIKLYSADYNDMALHEGFIELLRNDDGLIIWKDNLDDLADEIKNDVGLPLVYEVVINIKCLGKPIIEKKVKFK